MMQFDEIYKIYGNFGKYQFLIILLIVFPDLLSDAIALNFLTGRTDHYCRVPELQNLTEEQQKYIAIPYGEDTDDGYDGCNMFDIDYKSFKDEDFISWTRLSENTSTRDCDDGWIYDRSTFTETTVTAFDLVCGNSWMVPLPGTLEFAGAMVGTFTAGNLSDRYGRKFILIIFMIMNLIGGVFASVSPKLWVFCLGKVIQGFCRNGIYVAAFLIVMELIGPKYRGITGITIPIPFSLSFATGALLAYFMRDFRVLQGVMTGVYVIWITLFWLFLPEPPRWLIQHDRLEEAGDVLRKLGKMNKRRSPENLDQILTQIRDEEKSEASRMEKRKTCIDLYASPVMLLRALAINFHWFTDSLMYYALSLNAGSLVGNIFLNTALLGLVEIPAAIVGAFFIAFKYTGRRFTVSMSLVLAGISALVLAVLSAFNTSGNSRNAMSFLGKAFVTIAFNGIYVYSVETFPTEVRHVGMGSASVCARIGGMIAPYMGPPMEKIWKPLPSMIFGACAFLAGLGLLILPETLGLPLCQTIKEAEQRTVQGYLNCKAEFEDKMSANTVAEEASRTKAFPYNNKIRPTV